MEGIAINSFLGYLSEKKLCSVVVKHAGLKLDCLSSNPNLTHYLWDLRYVPYLLCASVLSPVKGGDHSTYLMELCYEEAMS